MWVCDLCTFSGCLIGEIREKDEVRHNMTLMATCSLLTVLTVLFDFGLKYLHFTVRQGRLVCETNLPMKELDLKVQGGIIAGFYSTCA